MKSNRLTAFEILYSVFYYDAYSNIAIDKVLKNYNGEDKAFVSNLVYGVIERQITLDYLLKPYLQGKTKPKVRIILLMGAYQLYFMDKVPSSAAINESVALAGKVGVDYYKKLVNAVLHKVDTNRIDIDSIDDLSVKYSCPHHLINMWQKMYGDDNTLSVLNSINEKPPVFAVPNSLYIDADELLYELNCCDIQGEVVGDVVMITSAFNLAKCKAFNDGLFHIEDMSSFNCAKALNAKAGDIVLDICAAPGGKSFTIAQGMNNDGVVYAFDLYEHRCKLIEDGALRLGITNIKTSVNDATVFNSDLPLADKILCDVPCSGFGIIRRKPEIRYKDLDSVKELPQIQYKILDTSSKYLKTNGQIIYSTCTLNKKENEKVVDLFLKNNKNFVKIKEQTTFTSKDGGDGFYFALMEKTDD